MLPVSSTDQVGVGALQGHRPRVTAQNPNNSGGQLFYPWDNGAHRWNYWFATYITKINTSEVKGGINSQNVPVRQRQQRDSKRLCRRKILFTSGIPFPLPLYFLVGKSK